MQFRRQSTSEGRHSICELASRRSEAFTENAILELLMLAGFYRTVSYLTNGLRLPLESAGVRFPGKRD